MGDSFYLQTRENYSSLVKHILHQRNAQQSQENSDCFLNHCLFKQVSKNCVYI